MAVFKKTSTVNGKTITSSSKREYENAVRETTGTFSRNHSASLRDSGSSSSSSSRDSDWSGSHSSRAPVASSTSYTRPSSGGSSYTPPASVGSQSGSSFGSRDYHQEAKDAAARGDWSAVSRALAARQAKINAQGGNDRGTSNAQILANLQNLYQNSYNALPSTMRDTLGMAASGQLNGRGWEDGVDYLAQAQNYARAGDMDAAYDALRRRGFKMADTGSLGGGTSQDQAYALIQSLFDHSPGAAASYQGMLAENAKRLQEHPTIFGTGTNPDLAGKHFTSLDGKYIIYYDSKGTPFKAQPNNGQYGSTKYTPEYRALMERYVGGDGDTADLRRQLHNLDVVHSGNGRLIDQSWNWASGTPLPSRDAYQYWTDFDNDVDMYRNTGQDKDMLANLLARINRGESFSSPAQVPVTRAESYDDLPIPGRKVSGGGGGGGPSSRGGGLVSSTGGGVGGYAGDDLSQYIRDMYQQSLQAQLASLQSSYDQNAAAIRAQDDRIAQAYQAQRNQAAGQSELQRLYMAELGNYQGLNTGATGQMALAQGMALQNNLASLGTAESQDLAANGLALEQLLSAYRGNVDSAVAQSYSQLNGALYDEQVRQIQAAEAAAQAAQAQANWEAQFQYQMQQDALARQYQQQAAEMEYRQQMAQMEAAAGKQSASNAWDLAEMMLKNGVVPDEATLYAAGIDPGSAQALADSYKWLLEQKYAPKSTGSRSSGGGKSQAAPQSLDYSGLFNAAYDSGFPTSFIANNYGDYGFKKSTGLADEYEDWSFDSGKMDAYLRDINTAMTNGNTEAANSYIGSIWPGLSGREREQIQSLLSHYNDAKYTP